MSLGLLKTCRDCGKQFYWSDADAAEHAARGLVHTPKRCRPCRANARNKRAMDAALKRWEEQPQVQAGLSLDGDGEATATLTITRRGC